MMTIKTMNEGGDDDQEKAKENKILGFFVQRLQVFP